MSLGCLWWILVQDRFIGSFRGGPLEKLLWGVGNFWATGFFFVIKFLVWIVFRPWHEYLLGLIFVHQFFFPLILPCAKIFLYFARPHPGYKFSNGPSLNLPFSEWSRISDPVADHPLGSSQRNAPQVSLINYYLPSSCLPFSIFFRNNVIAIRCKSWCSFFHLKIRIHSHEYELVFICWAAHKPSI